MTTSKENPWTNYLWKAGLIGAGAVVAPFALTTGLGALGFTAAGITAGSYAAGFMSSYGGTVASGSMCAALQSVGAAGLGAAGTTIASSVGAVLGGVGIGLFFSKGKRNYEKMIKPVKNNLFDSLMGMIRFICNIITGFMRVLRLC